MGARQLATFALAGWAALAAAGALAAADATFTAALGWVPIGGAERSEVGGEGRVTATLSGSKLTVMGSFDGLPAKATAAKLRLGVAKGARGPGGGAAIGELRITSSTSGAVSGDVRLSGEQIEALRAGRLYLQIYSEKGVPPDHATLFGWFASGGSHR